MSHDRGGGPVCSMCADTTLTQRVKKINPEGADCVFPGTNAMSDSVLRKLKTCGVSAGLRLENCRLFLADLRNQCDGLQRV